MLCRAPSFILMIYFVRHSYCIQHFCHGFPWFDSGLRGTTLSTHRQQHGLIYPLEWSTYCNFCRPTTSWIDYKSRCLNYGLNSWNAVKIFTCIVDLSNDVAVLTKYSRNIRSIISPKIVSSPVITPFVFQGIWAAVRIILPRVRFIFYMIAAQQHPQIQHSAAIQTTILVACKSHRQSKSISSTLSHFQGIWAAVRSRHIIPACHTSFFT